MIVSENFEKYNFFDFDRSGRPVLTYASGLRHRDGDGVENPTYKANSVSFRLHRDDSNSLDSLNVGEFSRTVSPSRLTDSLEQAFCLL